MLLHYANMTVPPPVINSEILFPFIKLLFALKCPLQVAS